MTDAEAFKMFVEERTGLPYKQAWARLLGPLLAQLWREYVEQRG